MTYFDEFIDELLTKDRVCDIILPRLTQRSVLEETEGLPPRKSLLVCPFPMSLDNAGDGLFAAPLPEPRPTICSCRSWLIYRTMNQKKHPHRPVPNAPDSLPARPRGHRRPLEALRQICAEADPGLDPPRAQDPARGTCLAHHLLAVCLGVRMARRGIREGDMCLGARV